MSTGPDLFAPGLFAGTGFLDAFAWYRAHDPVARLRAPDGTSFHSVTRHADVLAVHHDTERWSSTGGMRLGSDAAAVSAVANRMLIVSDPPAHPRMKRVLLRPFARTPLARIAARVDDVVADVVGRACEHGGDDLLEHLRRIPTDVICAIMHLPRADWAWVGERTTSAFEDPSAQIRSTANGEVFKYFADLVRASRRGPANPFLEEMAGGLDDVELIVNLSGVLAGGNETTRYTLASVTAALAAHPDEWERLRSGAVGVDTAVEEALRWSVPGMHVLRTAAGPVELSGVRIEPGERVVTWFGSANRDERAFATPDRFDAGRSPNRHVSFGAGRHLCLGHRLARMEIASYLRALRTRVRRIEQAGEPRYNGSNFTWGIDRLPARLLPR